MSTAELRSSITQLVQGISDDSVLQAIYTLLSKASHGDEFSLTDEHLQLLDQRRADHLSGKSKSYSWDEVKNHARKVK